MMTLAMKAARGWEHDTSRRSACKEERLISGGERDGKGGKRVWGAAGGYLEDDIEHDALDVVHSDGSGGNELG